MARSAEVPGRPAVVVINPDQDVTTETFFAWLDELQSGEPVELPVSAAETLAEARAGGDVGRRSWPKPPRASSSNAGSKTSCYM